MSVKFSKSLENGHFLQKTQFIGKYCNPRKQKILLKSNSVSAGQHPVVITTAPQSTVNVIYLACKISGRKLFFNKLGQI